MRTHVTVGIMLTVLLVGAGLTWNRVAAHRADQVSVMWTGMPECTGARVDLAKDNWSEDRWSGPLIRAKRRMRCVITVEVHNDSGGTVQLEGARLPLMGPGGGAVLKVDMRTDPELWEVPSRFDNIDLIRRLDVTLQPGETTTFDLPLVFRDRGCSGGPGGSGRTYVYGFPNVTVKALLYSFEQSAVNDLAHSQNGPSSGCSRI
jgi:hypothetical protein